MSTPATHTDDRTYRVWVANRLPSQPMTAADALTLCKLHEARGRRVRMTDATWSPLPYAPIMRWDGFPA